MINGPNKNSFFTIQGQKCQQKLNQTFFAAILQSRDLFFFVFLNQCKIQSFRPSKIHVFMGLQVETLIYEWDVTSRQLKQALSLVVIDRCLQKKVSEDLKVIGRGIVLWRV